MRRRNRWIALGLSLGLVAAMAGAATAAPPAPNHKGCTTIKDGTLVGGAGNPIVTGYDQFGYDYQAHMFNGT